VESRQRGVQWPVVASLAIKLLGELVVERDGSALALPPSRKTRALLAYLVLTGRAHRREALCELFWDVTDDPRGALRWSLSKLRGLADDDTTRIDAGREEVELHLRGATVDALEVRHAIRGRSLDGLPIDELERHASRFRGDLLEGLELPDFDAYQAWCVAQREEMRSIRISILDELVHRLRAEPTRAVDHARLRVQLDPHEPHARADLIRILAAMGYRDEARAHATSGTRMATETGGTAALAEIAAAAREIDAPRSRGISRHEVAANAERNTAATTADGGAMTGAATSRRSAVEELQRTFAEGQDTAETRTPSTNAPAELPPGASDATSAESSSPMGSSFSGLSTNASSTSASSMGAPSRASSMAVEDVPRSAKAVSARRSAIAELQHRVAEGWRDHLDHSSTVVLGPPTSSSGVRPGAGSLIGRDAELARLDGLLVRDGACALVIGEPGIGKSSLLATWATRHPGRVISGRALDGGAGHPYQPWQDALRAMGTADVFAAPSDRARLFDSITSVLDDAAPIAVVLDDAQWLDSGSVALLAHLVNTLRERRVAFVIGARAGELADNPSLERIVRLQRQRGLVEIELAPFDAATTATLVRTVSERADVDRVFAQSAGNPLFALELARADGDALPETVSAAVRDRLVGLADEATNLLRWAAVIGRGVTLEELEASTALDGEAIVDALELLARRALLVADRDGAVSFAHDLVRRVVYEALSEPRRRLMHRRIAQSLAARANGDVDVALVAHHAALAHDSALAADTCLAAAKRSLRMFANADAHAVARRGLRHVEALHDPDRTMREIELLEVCIEARVPDDFDAAAKQLLLLAEHALDLGCIEHARIGYHLASGLRWQKGAWSDARKLGKQAHLISSRATSEQEKIIGIAEAAYCLVLLDKDLGEAQALADEAAARGRLANVQTPATHSALGLLHAHQGEIVEARAQFHTAIELARVRRDHSHEFLALEHLVQLELESGDVVEACARAGELAALGTRMRDGSEAPYADGLLALARIQLGEPVDDTLASAAERLANVDAKQRLAYVLSRAAWLDVERDRPDIAEQRARHALVAAEALERPTEIACARAVLARIARAAGDERGAAAHVDEIVARIERVSRPMRARIASVVGDRVPVPVSIDEEM
jgi:DNA-binding SARP family transcriptional activator